MAVETDGEPMHSIASLCARLRISGGSPDGGKRASDGRRADDEGTPPSDGRKTIEKMATACDRDEWRLSCVEEKCRRAAPRCNCVGRTIGRGVGSSASGKLAQARAEDYSVWAKASSRVAPMHTSRNPCSAETRATDWTP